MDSDRRHYTKSINKVQKSNKKPSKAKHEVQKKKKFLSRYHCHDKLKEMLDFAQECMIMKKKRTYVYFSSEQRKCPKFNILYTKLNPYLNLFNEKPGFSFTYVLQLIKYDQIKKVSEFIYEKNKISTSKNGKTSRKVIKCPKEKQNLNADTFIRDILYFANSDW